MSWKHEEPLEEDTTDDPTPQANPVENGNHEAPVGSFLGHPVTNLSEGGSFIRNPTPVESNHGQVSGVMNPYQPGPPADIDSAGLENGRLSNIFGGPFMVHYLERDNVVSEQAKTTAQLNLPEAPAKEVTACF